jgi:hypothetical protein
MRCVGYRQALEYLDGEVSLATFRDKGIFATRQLAKRQLTWQRNFRDNWAIWPRWTASPRTPRRRCAPWWRPRWAEPEPRKCGGPPHQAFIDLHRRLVERPPGDCSTDAVAATASPARAAAGGAPVVEFRPGTSEVTPDGIYRTASR